MKNKVHGYIRTRRILIFVSFLLFPVTLNYFSPYLVIAGASQGIITGSLIVFAALFVSSLIFGRAFCGWICPLGGMQDACRSINDQPSRNGFWNILKYLIWFPWIVIILILLISMGIKAVNPLFMTENVISIDEPGRYIIYYSVIILVFLMSILGRRRSFCHSLCWLAPFMVWGNKLKNLLRYPSLHLLAKAERCVSCKSCNQACPMSIDVAAGVKAGRVLFDECAHCGECASSCPESVLKLSWSWKEK